MNGILVPVLYGLSGICAYAAVHHGLIAWRRPVQRTHLWFALLCLLVACYVIAKAGAYVADSAEMLVAMRRVEITFVVMLFPVLTWFIGEYTGDRSRWLAVSISGFFFVILVANLLLPYGIQFIEFPRLERLALPWGEQIVDLRVHRRSAWHNAGWLGIAAVFAYGIYSCVRQYRDGAHRRPLTLALALALFGLFVLLNRLINHGFIPFAHVAEFGFLSLVGVMSHGLTRELRESERRIQAVLDNVPAVVYLKDLNGRYLLINRQYEELFHVTTASVAGKTDHDLFSAEQADVSRANDRRVLESGRPLEFEEVADKDGTVRTYFSLKFPLLYSDGTPYAVCSVSRDITERKQAESELQRHREALAHVTRVSTLGELSASLAHELNQPLAAILSNAQAGLRFLDRGNQDLQEFRELLQDIVHDDKRASAVISGLRSLARREQTQRERVDLAATLREILELLHSELLARQFQVETDFADGCAVLADKAQIQQVVLNLVMNAVEAMEAEPAHRRHLHISMSCTGRDEVQVALRDSGVGIPTEKLDKVFDPFWTTKRQGMGMGLAVCRSIIEAHGGEIWVERNAERGVTFYFKLPALRQDGSAQSEVTTQNIRAV